MSGDPVQEWTALPAETRARVIELAKKDRPYPDREVARVAVAWARATRTLPKWDQTAAAVCVPVPTAALSALHHFTEYQVPLPLALIGLVLLGLILRLPVEVLSRRREDSFASEVEAANLLWALESDGVAIGGTAEFLSAGKPRVDWVMAATMGLSMFLGWWAYQPFAEAVILGLSMAATMTTSGWTERWWRPAAGPVVILSETGPTFPAFRVGLPWTEVTYVDIAMAEGLPSVRWHLRAPEVPNGLPRFRRWWFARRLRTQGGVLTIPVTWLAEPPERLILTARRYLGAAVVG